MPFSQEFNDIYEFGIKATCKKVGAYCERVDEQQFNETILERIYNQIAKADFIISEMTGKNPNVFYETGYAHALNKQVVLLTRNADDIPFDLRHHPHIVYDGSIARLNELLTPRLRWCVEHPKIRLDSVDLDFEVFFDEKPLSQGAQIELRGSQTFPDQWACRVQLSVRNSSGRRITTDDLLTTFVVPPATGIISWEGEAISRMVRLHDGRSIFRLDCEPLLPEAWHQHEINLWGDGLLGARKEVALTLRLLTSVGPKSRECTLIINGLA